MKKFLKKYFPDFLILSGILLFIANHFFKFTRYSVNSISEYESMQMMMDYSENQITTTIHYDYVGFIASIAVVIGLYVMVRKYIIKDK